MIDLPTHVAIVPDGNRRWASRHGLPPLEGHRRGAEAMHTTVEHLIAWRIKYLTVWGFSADNWKRSGEEIKDIFHLLAFWIRQDTPWLNKHGVRLHHIGRIDELPDFLQLAINQSAWLTEKNTGMTLTLAFNYGGRTELIDALRRIMNEGVPSHKVDENLFSRYLYTDGMPDVDLVIRTAGELRLSNFLLWQTAYSEIYFTPLLWPDFDIKELEKALKTYSHKQRRFGGD